MLTQILSRAGRLKMKIPRGTEGLFLFRDSYEQELPSALKT
jgi:hypothetical protein